MHDNKNIKNEKNHNSSFETAKKDVKNKVQTQDESVEAACSPEFPHGCIIIDHEMN